MSTVTVSPGAEATTTLTVRNDGDIVEAYTLEVVGDCAAWTTVEPARVSLYPGTSETVTVRLAPPRSHEVTAGEVPLGVRVLPAEHPESVAVPEATVVVEPFSELRARLEPGRRRGWLGARFRASVQNRGNAPVDVVLTGKQEGEELRLAFTPERLSLKPGESAESGLRVRARKLIWFGAPTTWPFEVRVAESEGAEAEADRPGRPEPLPGEFAQLPLLPKWLLIVLAALLALLVAWFALVRPAVRSTAKEAATAAAQKENKEQPQGGAATGGTTGGGDPAGGQGQEQGKNAGTGGTDGTGTGGAGTGGSASTGGGGANAQQSSQTIDVQTDAGAERDGTYPVPQGKVFGVTDIVVANFQGDEGVLTISFGERKITTIALETFRNQDYHWVTPIRIQQNDKVTVSVTCSKPGTPATGKQASKCHQVLNVSGVLSDFAP
ncbi:COG1470 family protein [Streptomyces sp. OR43]|uniref:COG1470 family protein n=1 Tax=Streptomyces sp. or43 TaxID=2478957 RepID=UPI0011CD7186|nr:hydrolytic protein [Streptomyces sp. or43]TXS42907.1 hydrolytic protein [Streptomyces sp. or43]